MKRVSLCASVFAVMLFMISCNPGSTSSSSEGCDFPLVADSTGKSCVCPAGMTQSGNLCINETPTGASWQTLPSPKSLSQYSHYDLNSGWGSSRNDVWISGFEYLGSAGCPTCTNDMKSVLLHWDGVSWTDLMHNALPDQPYTFWAFGANDVWVQTSQTPTDSVTNPALYHWDGANWTGPDAPALSLTRGTDYIPGFSIIPGSAGPNDLWAKIHYPGRTTITHWDGNAWTTKFNSTGTVSALSPNNIWEANGTTLNHFDGVSWTAVGTIPDEVAADVQVSALFGLSAHDVWVGQDNLFKNAGAYTRVLRHFDGTTWTTFDIGFVDATYTLNSLWGTAPDNIWAAAGRWFGDQSGIKEQGFILHWDGKTWSQTVTFDGIPGSIWGDANDVWVSVNHWYTLGKPATVLHRGLN